MILTQEEQEMLDGKKGPAVQKAAEILVALAESYGAERLIKVAGVHMPGASLVVTGDAGARFVEETAGNGGRFVADVTTNPTAIDPERWSEIGISKQHADAQQRLTDAYRSMGAWTCSTCTPYLVGVLPRLGQHIAWGESSAVAFANSVLGARTNREGGPSALASALTGRTVLAGFHLKENRAGTMLVSVRTKLHTSTDYSLLGYYVGKLCENGVPVFDGIPEDVTLEDLKQLAASLASSAAVSLFHVVGITPEAPTLEAAFQGRRPAETIDVDAEDLDETRRFLSKAESSQVSWVVVGCPHLSMKEMRKLASLMSGKRVKSEVEFWAVTSPVVKAAATDMGYVGELERAGVKVITSTCPVLTFTREIARAKGYYNLATNSAKMAHYAPGQFGLLPFMGTLEQCVDAAVTGVWRW